MTLAHADLPLAHASDSPWGFCYGEEEPPAIQQAR